MACIDAGSAPMTSFSGRGNLLKFQAFIWAFLLNWIDFQSEIGEHCRLVVAEITGVSKYLNTLNFSGSGLD